MQGTARLHRKKAVTCRAVEGWEEEGTVGWRDRGTEDRGTCGHTHREGGLGHLAAVVRDAPAEAAGDAAAVVLLLAAHHGLHGVAAHADGSLCQRGQQVVTTQQGLSPELLPSFR